MLQTSWRKKRSPTCSTGAVAVADATPTPCSECGSARRRAEALVLFALGIQLRGDSRQANLAGAEVAVQLIRASLVPSKRLSAGGGNFLKIS
jgi:hypothetical protein